MLRKTEGKTRGQQRIRWLDSITDSMNLSKTPGHEFDQTPGDSGGQRSLARCTPGDGKELPMTQQLNNKNNKALMFCYNAN